MKKKTKKKTIKDLHLDKETSHGGWPSGHKGSYTDPNTPVHKQISDYLESMGLIDDSNPRARLSEQRIRKTIRKVLKEMWQYASAQIGEMYENIKTGQVVRIIDIYEYPAEPGERHEIVYYKVGWKYPDGTQQQRSYKARHFHSMFKYHNG
tara:strand:+ start:1991 stop:2443 length:453 start_codon:yes stop_codon:yes gene_type:complete